jgi:hypothetical protein
MTDPTNAALDGGDDVELITRMLNGQLDPVRVAAVRKRLEEDAAFRELAAPLLLLWSLPKHHERFPRPAGEAERDLERLQQRIRAEIPTDVPVDVPAAAPPRPTGIVQRISRIFEAGLWTFFIYVIVVGFGAILWFDVLKPTFFP